MRLSWLLSKKGADLFRETERNSWTGRFTCLWTACLQAKWPLLCLCAPAGSTECSGVRPASCKCVWKSVSLSLPLGLDTGYSSEPKEIHPPYPPQFFLRQFVLRSRQGGEGCTQKHNPTPAMRSAFWPPLVCNCVCFSIGSQLRQLGRKVVITTPKLQKPCWFNIIYPLIPCFLVSFCKTIVSSHGSQREVTWFMLHILYSSLFSQHYCPPLLLSCFSQPKGKKGGVW